LSDDVSMSSKMRWPPPTTTGMIQRRSSSTSPARRSVASRRLLPYLIRSFPVQLLDGGDDVRPEEGGVPRDFGERSGGDVFGHRGEAVEVGVAAAGRPVVAEPLIGDAAHEERVVVVQLLHGPLGGFLVEDRPPFWRFEGPRGRRGWIRLACASRCSSCFVRLVGYVARGCVFFSWRRLARVAARGSWSWQPRW
jgi:hypothetical protein